MTRYPRQFTIHIDKRNEENEEGDEICILKMKISFCLNENIRQKEAKSCN